MLKTQRRKFRCKSEIVSSATNLIYTGSLMFADISCLCLIGCNGTIPKASNLSIACNPVKVFCMNNHVTISGNTTAELSRGNIFCEMSKNLGEFYQNSLPTMWKSSGCCSLKSDKLQGNIAYVMSGPNTAAWYTRKRKKCCGGVKINSSKRLADRDLITICRCSIRSWAQHTTYTRESSLSSLHVRGNIGVARISTSHVRGYVRPSTCRYAAYRPFKQLDWRELNSEGTMLTCSRLQPAWSLASYLWYRKIEI